MEVYFRDIFPSQRTQWDVIKLHNTLIPQVIAVDHF